MSDIWDSITSYLKDRAVSPLTGALILSWLAWNHRLIFTLFSSMEIPERFAYINENLYPTWFEASTLLLIGPIASAAAYLLLYHKPALWFYRRTLDQRTELLKAKQKAEGSRLITVEQRDRLIKKHEKEVGELERELRGATEQLNTLEASAGSMASKLIDMESVLTELQATDVTLHKDDGKKAEAKRALLLSARWQLHFNTKHGQSKTMSFGANGEILEGRNQNEDHWEIVEGKLLIYNSQNQVHSVFRYDINKPAFVMRDAESTHAKVKGQFMAALPKS